MNGISYRNTIHLHNLIKNTTCPISTNTHLSGRAEVEHSFIELVLVDGGIRQTITYGESVSYMIASSLTCSVIVTGPCLCIPLWKISRRIIQTKNLPILWGRKGIERDIVGMGGDDSNLQNTTYLNFQWLLSIRSKVLTV